MDYRTKRVGVATASVNQLENEFYITEILLIDCANHKFHITFELFHEYIHILFCINF